jgi:hypothetical protein
MKRMVTFVLAVGALCSLGAQTPATPRVVDWKTLSPEILERYRALVQLDTTAGHETRAVDYLRKVLEAEGIPTQTFALDPDRANLVARLKGNGSRRPLLILAHTDVVGVQREKWPVDPFGAVMKDGYIWGRGSKDDKPVLAANLMTMLMLKRLGVQLDRDVIFLAESGEEYAAFGVVGPLQRQQLFMDFGCAVDGDGKQAGAAARLVPQLLATRSFAGLG